MLFNLLRKYRKNLSKIISSPIKNISETLKGIKILKHYFDDKYREKVKPIPGSVLYSDLIGVVEHSGIYIKENKISNIKVDKFLEGTVKISSPSDFTEKSLIYKKIYVSCDKDGAVGDYEVGKIAYNFKGKRSFYGLLFSNCHSFSKECLCYTKKRYFVDRYNDDVDETWEPTIKNLKKEAKEKIGATKWKLWDWENNKQFRKVKEPDFDQLIKILKSFYLKPEIIMELVQEKIETQNYIKEISDEDIPNEAINILNKYLNTVDQVITCYQMNKDFLELSDYHFSYKDLIDLNDNYNLLAEEMKNNNQIKMLLEKLGGEYLAEEQKQIKSFIKSRAQNELYGLKRDNKLDKILPVELINLIDEELEYLFYAKMYEKSLLSYELIGSISEEKNVNRLIKTKGPIIACLDTSGSMDNSRIIKAKSLLLTVTNILEEENRKLYVLLFGGENEIQELNLERNDSNRLLKFISKGYYGNTDFNGPLLRSINILKNEPKYGKADILMITDGISQITSLTEEKIKKSKKDLKFNIYTVICNNTVQEDNFSDEIIKI